MSPNFWQFSFGNVVTLLSGIFATLALWWKVAQRDQKTADDFEALRRAQEAARVELDGMTKIGLLTTVNQHERRLLECERVTSSISALQTDVSWIKNTLANRQ
jgi:hypothetical protein